MLLPRCGFESSLIIACIKVTNMLETKWERWVIWAESQDLVDTIMTKKLLIEECLMTLCNVYVWIQSEIWEDRHFMIF